MPIEQRRKRLLARLTRWESELATPSDDIQPTRKKGAREECFEVVEAMLKDCHLALEQVCGEEANYSLRKPLDKLSLGERIEMLAEIEPKCRFVLQRLRRDLPIRNSLISGEDLKLLRRFNEIRVGHTHREETPQVLMVIRSTRHVCSLPLFDLCRRLEVPTPSA